MTTGGSIARSAFRCSVISTRLSRAGRDGNTSGSNAGNEHRCTGWEASRDGTPICSSCGSSACDRRLEGRSRMRREFHVRFCEGGRVRFPSATRLLKLTAGCALEATGTIVPSPAKGQPFEMQASAIKVVGWVDDPDTYPIQPKPHTLEFLREVAHLRPRTNVIGAVTRVRHTLAQAVHRFFHERGFFWIHTPIITASDAEGAGQMFRVSTL